MECKNNLEPQEMSGEWTARRPSFQKNEGGEKANGSGLPGLHAAVATNERVGAAVVVHQNSALAFCRIEWRNGKRICSFSAILAL